jgi:hypothetical protein
MVVFSLDKWFVILYTNVGNANSCHGPFSQLEPLQGWFDGLNEQRGVGQKMVYSLIPDAIRQLRER